MLCARYQLTVSAARRSDVNTTRVAQRSGCGRVTKGNRIASKVRLLVSASWMDAASREAASVSEIPYTDSG